MFFHFSFFFFFNRKHSFSLTTISSHSTLQPQPCRVTKETPSKVSRNYCESRALRPYVEICIFFSLLWAKTFGCAYNTKNKSYRSYVRRYVYFYFSLTSYLTVTDSGRTSARALAVFILKPLNVLLSISRAADISFRIFFLWKRAINRILPKE